MTCPTWCAGDCGTCGGKRVSRYYVCQICRKDEEREMSEPAPECCGETMEAVA